MKNLLKFLGMQVHASSCARNFHFAWKGAEFYSVQKNFVQEKKPAYVYMFYIHRVRKKEATVFLLKSCYQMSVFVCKRHF